MAVTAANILAKGTWGPKRGPGWTDEYQITMEAFTDTSMRGLDVLASNLIPKMFSLHPDDARAKCIGIEPQQDEDDANYWVIVFRYSTRIPEFAQGTQTGGNQQSPTQPQNPLDRKPKVRLSTKMFKRLTFLSLDGDPIVNGAGDPYEGTMLEIPRLVIHVTRNIQGFDYDLVNLCSGAVNDDIWLGYAARRIKCENLTADESWEQDVYFWKVQAELIVANVDDLMGNQQSSGMWWYDWKLNAGYHYKNASGTLVPFLLPGGQKPTRPLLLKTDGTRLNGTGFYVAGGDSVNFIGRRVLRDAPLDQIGLFN